MFLRELVEKNRVCFHQSFSSWEEAVAASCQPLLDDGSIGPEYVDSVIACVKKYGPYIVLRRRSPCLTPRRGLWG